MKKDNTYAIVHKTQCCANWKKSFMVIPYRIDGTIQEISWSKVTGCDNVPELRTAEEYQQLQGDSQLVMPKDTKWVVDCLARSDDVMFFDDYNKAVEALWGAGATGDWAYQLFTAEKARRELLNSDYWLGQYRDNIESELSDMDNYELAKEGYSTGDYYEYIYNNTTSGTFDAALAEIIINNSSKNRRLINYLNQWTAEHDDLGDDFWNEFCKDIEKNRFTL